MAFVDHCQTAEDVRNNARLVMERRRAQWRRTQVEMHAPKPIIHPARLGTVTKWDGRLWTGGIDFLICSAYPRRYPTQTVRLTDIDRRISVREIIVTVADISGVSVVDIISARRNAALVLPRQVAIALARLLTIDSFPKIARVFGGRDHTTAAHSCQKMAPVMAATAAALPSGGSLDEWARTALKFANTMTLKCVYRRKPKDAA